MLLDIVHLIRRPIDWVRKTKLVDILILYFCGDEKRCDSQQLEVVEGKALILQKHINVSEGQLSRFLLILIELADLKFSIMFLPRKSNSKVFLDLR
jgi:hypothetical protein